MSAIRRLLTTLGEDWDTVIARDPSIVSKSEALLHPALPALWMHRIAFGLHRRDHRRLARLVMVTSRAITGVEIHPGAKIGHRVFIDHGGAVVIGETAIVEDDVTIYHQVTLGAVGWWRDQNRPEGERRHPKVGARSIIGVNATVLGPVSVGADVIVGAHALVTHDVSDRQQVHAPRATVHSESSREHQPAIPLRHNPPLYPVGTQTGTGEEARRAS